jgi:bacillithiol biosynthesis cysteine-adding enzyme BshC
MESQGIHIYSQVNEHEFSEENLNARAEEIRNRSTALDFNSLQDFNIRQGAGASSQESISLLKNNNAFCVVTGQQTGVLGSPLLSLYKLISAEIYSRHLQERLNHPVVPVFWLQTEDHDLEEISTINILNQGLDPKSITLDSEAYKNSFEQKLSVGSISFSENTYDTIVSFLSSAGYSILNYEFKEILKTSINKNETLSTSFAKWMFSIAPQTKAVFIDPRLSCFDALKKNIFKDAFIKNQEISRLLLEHTSMLREKGRETPVLIKPDSPLPFFHPEGGNAPRYRLEYRNNQYTYGPDNRIISQEELLTQLDTSPASFSSSALLRPVIQDYMLPSLAYIGGATELNYLEQTKPLYPFFGIKTPLWIPRAQSIVLDQKNISFLSSLSYDPNALLVDNITTTQNNLKDIFLSSMENADALQEKINPLLSQIETILSDKPLSHDPNLERPLQKTIEGSRNNIAKFLEKYNQSILRSDEVFSRRLEKLLHIAFPNGMPQERVLSSIWLVARYGITSIELLYSSIDKAYQVHSKNVRN